MCISTDIFVSSFLSMLYVVVITVNIFVINNLLISKFKIIDIEISTH